MPSPPPPRTPRLFLVAGLAAALGPAALQAAEVIWLETPTARQKLKIEDLGEPGLRVVGRWSFPRGAPGQEATGTPAAMQAYDEGLRRHGAGDHAGARARWLESASGGCARAAHALALQYRDGRGGPASAKEELRWMEAAAEGNIPKAQAYLALKLGKGEGVEKDRVASNRWLARAALLGDATSAYLLGHAYHFGLAKIRCWDLAEVWYRRASEAGEAKATSALESLGGSETEFRRLIPVQDIPLEGERSARRLPAGWSPYGGTPEPSGPPRTRAGFEKALQAAVQAFNQDKGKLAPAAFAPRVAAVLAASEAFPDSGLQASEEMMAHFHLGSLFGRLAQERLFPCQYARPEVLAPGWKDWRAPPGCDEPTEPWAEGAAKGLVHFQEAHLRKAFEIAVQASTGLPCGHPSRTQVALATARIRFVSDSDLVARAWDDLLTCVEEQGGWTDPQRLGVLREYLEWQSGGRKFEVVALTTLDVISEDRMRGYADAFVEIQGKQFQEQGPAFADAVAVHARLQRALYRQDPKRRRLDCLNAQLGESRALGLLSGLPAPARQTRVLPNGVVVRGAADLTMVGAPCG